MLKDKNDLESVHEFMGNLKFAFTEAGIYLQKEYAVDNDLLSNLSTVNPFYTIL